MAGGGILLDAIINLWYTSLVGYNKTMIKFNNKGFTYIELVLAMAIIAFIVLAFSQLFLRTTVSVKGMEFQTLAYNFAADKMEEIKNETFGAIGNPWYPAIWETDSQTPSGVTFTRNVRVSALASSLIRVDIEVIWTEGGGNKSIEVSTLIAEKW
jgi:prepilin-type N-terminal cleavage/methylation domain-containing protein